MTVQLVSKIRVASLIALCLMGFSAFANDMAELSFSTEAVQGALIIGKTEAGSTVTIDGKPVPITRDGRFVFGIARDATGDIQVVVTTSTGTVIDRPLPIKTRTYDIERVDGLPPKTVSPPPEWLERRKGERARVRKGRAEFRETHFWADGFLKPAEGRYSGFYGSQRILNGQPRTPHYGLDIAAPAGTPVVAPASGIVTLADGDFLLEGGIVILDHGYRVTSTLFHLQTVSVKEGDFVEKGQVIGEMGATGRATGSHVDWRINWGSVRLDPLLALTKEE